MSQEKYLDLADGKFARGVVLIDSTTGLPINSEGIDRELVVTTYFVKTAFTGASIGDTITATQVIDVSSTPSTVSTVWRNQTTAADLVSVPSAANLTLLGSQALSDAQLRASAVPVTANAGTNLNTSLLALETTQAANGVLVGAVVETAPASDTASSGLNGRLQRIAQRLTSLIALLPASLGIKTAAASLSIAPASDATFTKTPATTGAQTIVVSSATDVTILASNAARKGAIVYNDSTAALYLLLANTTSSATVFTVKVAAAGTFVLENGDYTGVIKGIWAAANGNARVTELV